MPSCLLTARWARITDADAAENCCTRRRGLRSAFPCPFGKLFEPSLCLACALHPGRYGIESLSALSAKLRKLGLKRAERGFCLRPLDLLMLKEKNQQDVA
jgi:hypothetical protein